MDQPIEDPSPQQPTDVDVRVRYTDCDPMGVAHHSVYPVWLEIARMERLRQRGVPYRDLEKRGVLFVVARMALRYKRPARYDDVLRLCIWEVPDAGRAPFKVDHLYEIRRDQHLLATASTTMICVDREGKFQVIPEGVFG